MFRGPGSGVYCLIDLLIFFFLFIYKKTGNNIVFIGICGPKGQSDEVSIKHLGENIYNVNYRVQDRGQYVVVVKWGDEQIPDSPFHLECI